MGITERERKVSAPRMFLSSAAPEICCDFVADSWDASLGRSAAAAWGAGVSSAVLFAGESVSSDTSLGCGADVDIALVAWQAAEDDPEAGSAVGTGEDPAAPRWLQLSPSQEPTNLTGSICPTLCVSSHVCPKEELVLFAWLMWHMAPSTLLHAHSE